MRIPQRVTVVMHGDLRSMRREPGRVQYKGDVGLAARSATASGLSGRGVRVWPADGSDDFIDTANLNGQIEESINQSQ
jgi:hypothetical protein